MQGFEFHNVEAFTQAPYVHPTERARSRESHRALCMPVRRSALRALGPAAPTPGSRALLFPDACRHTQIHPAANQSHEQEEITLHLGVRAL